MNHLSYLDIYLYSYSYPPSGVSQVGATLTSVKLFDKCTVGTLFPCLVAPILLGSNDRDEEKPFFSFVFEVSPLNLNADYRLLLEMLPLEIVYNKSCIDRVSKYSLYQNVFRYLLSTITTFLSYFLLSPPINSGFLCKQQFHSSPRCGSCS